MSYPKVSIIPLWGIPRVDAGYIYIIEVDGRLKIGKSKHKATRIRAAKTWLPNMKLVGVKPFWLISEFEKSLHIGLAQWWYEGEWFHPGEDPYLEDFIHNFRAFSDDDTQRDWNSINFVHWRNDFSESAMEWATRQQSLRAFQRDVSESKKSS